MGNRRNIPAVFRSQRCVPWYRREWYKRARQYHEPERRCGERWQRSRLPSPTPRECPGFRAPSKWDGQELTVIVVVCGLLAALMLSRWLF